MAEQTEAQSAAMAATAAKFDQGNADLQQMLSTLMSRLSVLSGSWKGQGATAFEGVRAEYEADLKKLNNALTATADAIRASGKSYDASDSEAASRVAKTGGTFNLPL